MSASEYQPLFPRITKCQHLIAAKDLLEQRRFSLLTDALGKINAELSQVPCPTTAAAHTHTKTLISPHDVARRCPQVFQFLTDWCGDAYLQYTSDPRLLFTTGISLQVRPDQHRWRPFPTLSGGQQAVATLALAFAMQAAFPSPFYFFDEAGLECRLSILSTSLSLPLRRWMLHSTH